jgi:hypothetical protein
MGISDECSGSFAGGGFCVDFFVSSFAEWVRGHEMTGYCHRSRSSVHLPRMARSALQHAMAFGSFLCSHAQCSRRQHRGRIHPVGPMLRLALHTLDRIRGSIFWGSYAGEMTTMKTAIPARYYGVHCPGLDKALMMHQRRSDWIGKATRCTVISG